MSQGVFQPVGKLVQGRKGCQQPPNCSSSRRRRRQRRRRSVPRPVPHLAATLVCRPETPNQHCGGAHEEARQAV